ncbi:Hypothetical predicted protein [Cloeon dipterum]|uniref:Very long-chain fatty acid transport protein n=2 Tax=Cloeon dipterum TaxID=197152 RepID=A0A8S1C1P0_9INSE|nr:Hypothetical predicted protein [Cloeon dipterum]
MDHINYKVVFCLLGVILVVGPWLQIFCLCALAFYLWNAQKISIILRTLPRDLGFITKLYRIIRKNQILKRRNFTPASMLSDLAAKYPEQPCFLFEDQVWSYKQVNELSWRVARVFHERGYKRGDVVALVSSNRPEYVAIWVGLSRLGVITALVNNTLRTIALQHSLEVVKPKGVIVSAELCPAVKEVEEDLSAKPTLFKFCGADQQSQLESPSIGFELLNSALDQQPGTPIIGLMPPSYKDELIYIYTSGTTGLPKAAVLRSSRYLFGTLAARYFANITKEDRIYNPLPLYHSAGGVVGVGPAITMGVSCVIKSKFSASKYFEDCAKYECTVGQYIGEMCRYLLATRPSEYDQKHKIRIMLGNGLKKNVWQSFVDRFNINGIVEFYGATEGNTNIVNIDGTVGAVGFQPRLLPDFLNPMGLIKVDEETSEVLRGPDGLCFRCLPGEPGMFVGKIKEGDATREFHGYVDKKASSKKVATNVFKKNDKYFLSGDILVMDELGYLYFKDRTGDTFRWKGENVSTTEVENAITKAVGLQDACVYGVEIPNTDGKAGMATIVDADDTVDISKLGKSLAKYLPPYAQPIFVRLAKKIDVTSTFKLKKFNLQKEGFNPANVGSDRLYFRVSKDGDFKELTSSLYEEIVAGKVQC